MALSSLYEGKQNVGFNYENVCHEVNGVVLNMHKTIVRQYLKYYIST